MQLSEERIGELVKFAHDVSAESKTENNDYNLPGLEALAVKAYDAGQAGMFTVNELQLLRTIIVVKLTNALQYPAANRNLIPLLKALAKKLKVPE